MTARHSIAIVGSGPSGCYTAQAIRKLLPSAKVTVFDRLPVPYGLIRYGVAPDHVGTKNVSDQFDRLFHDGNMRFVGNVNVGTTVSLEKIQECFDVTVIATRQSEDRCLSLPGVRLPGVLGSGYFSKVVNEHPHESQPLRSFGKNVVVIGHGNVAIDIVRLLAKSTKDFLGSEMSEDVLSPAADGITRIEAVGRSPIPDAKFDALMVKKLARLSGVAFEIHDHSSNQPQRDLSKAQLARMHAVQELSTLPPPLAHRLVVSFRFGLKPAEFLGIDQLAGIDFLTDDRTLHLPADTAITAVGFEAAPDGLSVRAPNAPDIFRVGWAAHGASGNIPWSRAQAKTTAVRIASWINAHPGSKTRLRRHCVHCVQAIGGLRPMDQGR